MKLKIKGERDKQLTYAFIGMASLIVLMGAGNVLTGCVSAFSQSRDISLPRMTAPAQPCLRRAPGIQS